MKTLILSLLSLYKKTISPLIYKLLGHGCRYSPTCAEYSKEAIERYGVARGGVLTTRRLLSCHPLSQRPFFDPVPPNLST